MWRATMLFCLGLVSMHAQTPIERVSGSWTTLDGTWQWHEGDNPTWASAALPEADWSPLPVPGPLPRTRRFWIRLSVEADGVADTALLLGPIGYAYDVYWDGQRIGRFGNVSLGTWFTPRWQTYLLPQSLNGPGRHIIALRLGQIGTNFGTRNLRLLAGDNRIGDRSTLQSVADGFMRADLEPRFLNLLVDFALLLAGLYFLLLPPSVAVGTAFRWLGLTLLGRSLMVLCAFYVEDGPLKIPANFPTALLPFFSALFFIGPVEFVYSIFRRRVPRAVRFLEGFILIVGVTPLTLHSSMGAFITFNGYAVAAGVPIVVAAQEFRKRRVNAGSILLLFAVWGAVTFNNVLKMVYGVPLPTAIYPAGFRIWYWDFALLLWVPAIAVQIHKRNAALRHEQERLQREMEAAQHVQQLLVPANSVRVPGFAIEAHYRPATEVGGDFFQLFVSGEESLLVVVGDVSGKGVQAALLVSLVIGALRNRHSDRPGCILRELNTALVGVSEGGFTTCCCARCASDGTVTIANAGHIPPYRNGEEIATPPGLPLGLTADAEWDETQFSLQPGDRLLWVSDGVIEAGSQNHELLGFDRTQELAKHPASEIAMAAQEFGQEDDITILSVTREKAQTAFA